MAALPGFLPVLAPANLTHNRYANGIPPQGLEIFARAQGEMRAVL
jgi:hypothetical protein